MRLSPLILLLLAGCPKDQPVEPIADWSSQPRLPSPTAGTYQRAPATPTDPAIATLMGNRAWDESLSGAAASLALAATKGEGRLERWAIREAAWQAGYPYPVTRAKVWSTLQSSPPPDELERFVEVLDKDLDLGLVRARAPSGDAWVALVGQPRHDLGMFHRQRPVGASMVFPPVEGARYAIADADGGVRTGSLDTKLEVTLGLPGEWLFHILDGSGTIALFPVYVGVEAPEEPLLLSPDDPVSSTGEAREQVHRSLDEIREIYGSDRWTSDMLLDAAADRVLQGHAPEEGLTTWSCHAPTVEDCLDRWVWDVHKRPVLLSDELTHMGIAVDLSSAGLDLVLVLSS